MSHESDDTRPSEPKLALIAEDEPLASMALRAQLEALGFDVVGPARDGELAVALGACFPVDIALFDLRMPRLSGLEAAHRLFDIAPTPVGLLTGTATADLPDPVPEPPIFHVLTKPVTLEELRTGVDTLAHRFGNWARTHRHVHLEQLREQRRVTARAVRTLAQDGRLASTAHEVLQQAERQDRPLHEVAADLLQERA